MKLKRLWLAALENGLWSFGLIGREWVFTLLPFRIDVDACPHDTRHWYQLTPPSSSNPGSFCRSEKLRQVLKCIHKRLWEENCAIFASEWCNSKAMIESKTITMKQFSMPHTFHIFSDILYLVCGEVCQDTWVMGLLSTGNISHSEEWAGEEIWKKQFVINRLCLLHH